MARVDYPGALCMRRGHMTLECKKKSAVCSEKGGGRKGYVRV